MGKWHAMQSSWREQYIFRWPGDSFGEGLPFDCLAVICVTTHLLVSEKWSGWKHGHGCCN